MVNPANVRVEKEFKHTSPLIGCRFDPAGRFLFVSAQDNSLQRWNLADGTKTPLVGHESWVRGMAFLPPSKPGGPATLVAGDYHGKLVWWPADADKPEPTRTIAAHDGWVRAVAVSADGKLVASCGNDRLVKLWTADGKSVRTLSGHADHVYHVAFHPDGTRLASCDLKGVVKDWDIAKGTCVRDLDAAALHKYDTTFGAFIGGARGMTFDPAGGRLAVSGITNVSNAFAGIGNPGVILFDWKDGKPKQLKTKDAFQGTAWNVAFHPAGFVVAAGAGSGGRVWFWTGDDPTSSHTFTTTANARDMAVYPSGERLAVAGSNGTAYLLSLLPAPPAPSAAKPKK